MAHKFHPSILREYDIRGIFGKTLNLEDAKILGQIFGTKVKRSGGSVVCVGYDVRLSSWDLADALTSGLVKSGIRVLKIEQGPTPLLYFAVHEKNADGGIMVTGSHNPPEYNGFKMVLNGKPFFGEEIAQLNKIASKQDFEEGPGTVEIVDVQDAYIKKILNGFRESATQIKPLSVGWDPGNGATCVIIYDLVQKLPGRHFLINELPMGTFPAHAPDPTLPEALEQLQKLVKENNLSIGLAFDGDGDRLGAVDEDGKIVWGDQLLALLTEDVLKHNPGAPIIADVKCGQNLFQAIEAQGGKPIMWKTGHSHIKKKMKEVGAPLAGEMSGHIFFADNYFGYDDAIYAALRVLASLMNAGLSLKEWSSRQPKTFATPEIRLECDGFDKFKVIDQLKTHLTKSNVSFNDIDGVRLTLKEGWWLLRASNTEEILVARGEGHTEKDLQKILNHMDHYLLAAGIKMRKSNGKYSIEA